MLALPWKVNEHITVKCVLQEDKYMSYLEYQPELAQQQICAYKRNTAQALSDHLVTMGRLFGNYGPIIW